MTEKNTNIDINNIEENMEEILKEIEGEIRPGTEETPNRFARACQEWFAGYDEDPTDHLEKTFEKDTQNGGDKGIVTVDTIEFYSHCEHHVAPFHGKAHIAYIPQGKVAGLSKFARLTDGYAKRLQIQEKLTRQIADAINQELDPKGVMVIIEAKHMCMCSRGVGKQDSMTKSSEVRGVFKEDAAARREAMELLLR